MRSYTRFASSWVLLLTFTSLCKAEPRPPHTSSLETYPWILQDRSKNSVRSFANTGRATSTCSPSCDLGDFDERAGDLFLGRHRGFRAHSRRVQNAFSRRLPSRRCRPHLLCRAPAHFRPLRSRRTGGNWLRPSGTVYARPTTHHRYAESSRLGCRRKPRRQSCLCRIQCRLRLVLCELYFHKFLGKNPFGVAPLDIKAYYMGLTGCSWDETRSSKLPESLKPSRTGKMRHNALSDALYQGEIFRRMMELRTKLLR